MFTAIVSVCLAAAFGALGWIFVKAENLSTRVTILETKETPLLALINSRFDTVESRLDRIEHNLDKE